MYNYVLLNSNGVCINALATPHEGVTLHKNTDTDSIIEITDEQFSYDLVGKLYQNGVFVDPQPVIDTPPPLTPEELIAQAKSNKGIELEQAYYASFSTFQSSATGTTKTYPINGEAQDDLKDLQNRLIADPNKNTFYFLTIDDGALVAHTRVQFLQLLGDAETFEVTTHNKYRGYVAQLNSATTIDEVNSIQWT
jgi:hypothetical protein